MTGMEAFGIS